MFWVAITRLPAALRVALARDSVRVAFPLPNPAKLAGYRSQTVPLAGRRAISHR